MDNIIMIVLLTGIFLGLAAVVRSVMGRILVDIVPIGPTGPIGVTGAELPGTAGYAGSLGPTGYSSGPIGPPGPSPDPTLRSAALTSVIYEELGSTGAFTSNITYVIPLENVPSGRSTGSVLFNPDKFEISTTTPGYRSVLIYKRPASGPSTWIRGIVAYTANIGFNEVRGGILAVGYSPVTSGALDDITRIASMGFGTDFPILPGPASQLCITLPFVAEIPSGSGDLQFFSFLDLAQQALPINGSTTSYSYSIEIDLL